MRRLSLFSIPLLVLALIAVGPASTPRAVAANGWNQHRADFDGDGRDDIVVGAFSWLQPGPSSDDLVVIRYGDGAQQTLAGLENLEAMTTGDLDGDGFDELAIGDDGDGNSLGRVSIYTGGAAGLAETPEIITQDSPGVPGGAEDGDLFGQALAAGDLTGDHRDELVIGTPNEDLGTIRNGGMVTILRGSAGGITTAGAIGLTENSPGVPGAAHSDDAFGLAVSVGDVTGDGRADLAIGTPGKNGSVGMIQLFAGSSSGITTVGVDTILGSSDPHGLNGIGWQLAVADTNGGGRAEVIGGVRYSNPTGTPWESGAIVSFLGRSTGISKTGMRVLTQDSAGVPDTAESYDHFGGAIAAGDVTGDGRADVIVGVPDENVGTIADAGGVVLLRGSSAGLTGRGSVYRHQASTGVPGVPEAHDTFGLTVSLADVNGDNLLDVVVGVPFERTTATVSGRPDGLITRFLGTPISGLATTAITVSGDSYSTPDREVFWFGRVLPTY